MTKLETRLFFTVVVFCVASSAAVVEGLQYSIREGSVVGSRIKLAAVEHDFERELYIYRGLGSCSNDDDDRTSSVPSRKNSSDWIADGVYDGRCPRDDCVYPSIDALCFGRNITAAAAAGNHYCECPPLMDACTLARSTKTLTLGVESETFSTPDVSVALDFTFVVPEDSLWTTAVTARPKLVYINMTVDKGEPDLYVTRLDLWQYDGKGWSFRKKDENFGGGAVLICPEDQLWGPGVYFVRVWSFDDSTAATGKGTSFRLHATASKPLPFAPRQQRQSRASCTTTIAGQTCLEDGKRYAWNKTKSGEEYFVFWANATVTECSSFAVVYFEAPEGSTVLVSTRERPTFSGYSRASVATPNWELTKGVMSVACDAVLYVSFDRRPGPAYLFFDSSRAWVELFPVSAMTPFDYSFEILSTSALRCRDKDFVCSRRGTAGPTFTEDCFRFWPSTFAFFYPRPPWSFGSSKWQNVDLPPIVNNNNDSKVPSTRYSFSVLMELSSIDSTLISTSSTQVYLRESELASCSMEFFGKLAFEDGTPVHLPDRLQNITEAKDSGRLCDAKEFEEAHSRISRYTSMMDETYDGEALRNLQFAQDATSFENPWFYCMELAESLLSSSSSAPTHERSVITDRCLSDAPGDPCCNLTLRWYSACRPRIVETTATRSVPDQDAIASKYDKAANCVSTMVTELHAMYQKTRDPSTGCEVLYERKADFEGNLWKPYVTCKTTWFGEDAYGLRCDHDLDCPGSAKCAPFPEEFLNTRRLDDDMFGYCVLDYARERTLGFLRCLKENLDSFVFTRVSKRLNATTIEKLYDASSTKMGCGDLYGGSLAVDANERWVFKKAGTSNVCSDYWCPPTVCVDSKCKLPFRCDAGQNCWKAWTRVPPPSECSSRVECNWKRCSAGRATEDGSVDTSTCAQECAARTGGFCALCEEGNDERCTEIDLSEEECRKMGFCRKNDGTTYLTNSSLDCEKNMSVTSGRCSDAFLFDRGPFAPVGERCIYKPLVPFVFLNGCLGRSAVDSTGGTSYVVSTPQGCIDPGLSGSSSCNTTARNSVVSLKRSENKEECTAFKACRLPYFDVRTSNGEIYVQYDAIDCGAAGGSYESVYVWKNETRRGGQFRRLKWKTNRTIFSRYSPANVFDFGKFFDSIQDAIDEKYAFQIRSVGRCRYDGVSKLLLSIVREGSNVFYDTSKSSSSSTTSGSILSGDVAAVTNVCGGSTSLLRTPVATVVFTKHTIPLGKCANVSLSVISSSRFFSRVPFRLSSFALVPPREPTLNFVNNLGATVGTFVGPGISLDFVDDDDDDDFVTEGTRICIVSDDDDNTFAVDDLATVSESEATFEVLPMEYDVVRDEVLGLCVTLRSNISSGLVYAPIRRSKSWKTDIKRLFDTAGIVIHPITSMTFFGLALFALYRSISSLIVAVADDDEWKKAVFNDRAFWSTTLIFLFAIDRSIVFLLASLQTSVDELSPALGYVLSELPSYLFFSVVTLFAISWMTILMRSRKLGLSHKNSNKVFFRIAGWVNGGLYLMFLIVVVLFEAIPSPPREPCLGVSLSDPEANRRVVQRIYRTILSLLSGILGVFVSIYGSRLYALTKPLGHSSPSSSSNKGLSPSSAAANKHRIRRVLFLTTLVCSIALAVQSIYLLITAFVQVSSSYPALFVVWITEIIPLCSMLVMLRKPQSSQQSHSKDTVKQESTTTL